MAIYLGANELATGGGSSVGLNGISQFANVPALYTDETDSTWLKAGNLLLDPASYPNAATSKYNIDISSLAGTYATDLYQSSPRWMQFSSDGTKFFLSGFAPYVIQTFNCSTPWDISTLSYVSEIGNGASNSPNAGHWFNNDGTKWYTHNSSSRFIASYNLGTPYDLTTLSYISQTGNLTGYGDEGRGIWSNLAGTKMYYMSDNSDQIVEFTLTTPYSPSTYLAGTAPVIKSIAAQDSQPNQLFISDDGTKLYTLGNANNKVYQYSMSAYNINTLSFVRDLDISAYDTDPTALTFKEDGTKMYISGTLNDTIYEFDLGTAWNISTTTLNQSYRVGSPDNAQWGIYINSSGSKMFTTGDDTNSVLSWNIGTPWDITTSSYIESFDISAQDTSPRGIFFKPEGDRMFVIGDVNNNVNQYNLSVAFDISSSTFIQSFNLSYSAPMGLFFKEDGLKMYVVDATTDEVAQYNLSSAWDISTASFLQSYSISSLDGTARGIYFSSDGDRMFITGDNNDLIYDFDLITPWNISTSIFKQSKAAGPNAMGISFKPTGDSYYILNYNTKEVNQYNIPIGVGLLDTTNLDAQSYVRIN
jgi:6-phosphogluconolactonase (cycloisomerase 2 family)